MLYETEISRLLRKFVRTTLQPLVTLPKHTNTHTALLSHLRLCTQAWQTQPPTRTFAEVCDTGSSALARTRGGQLDLDLRIPSKLHVLFLLYTECESGSVEHAELWKALINSLSRPMATQLISVLQCVSQRDVTEHALTTGYHWFHVNAFSVLEKMNQPLFIRRLIQYETDPLVQWCCLQWKTYPNMYSYFVPLDVQHAFEKHRQCAQTIRWTWSLPKHFSRKITDDTRRMHVVVNRSYTMKICIPHMSISPRILCQLAYRITMMSMLDIHDCTTMSLEWYPINRQKWLNVPSPIRSRSRCFKKKSSRMTKRQRRWKNKMENKMEIHLEKYSSCSHSTKPCSTNKCTTPPSNTWNPYQINTGATICGTCNSVTLWRREEALKTFLHEMMHGFSWDFEHPSQKIHQWVCHYFHVEPSIEIRFYENYVETWATLLNVYMAILHSYPHSNETDQLTRIKDAIEDERRFALFQAAKVMVNTGFTKWTDFFTDGTTVLNDSRSCPRMNQKTSVFSYYILRSMHLWNIDWFIQQFPFVRYNSNSVTKQQDWFEVWLNMLLSVSRSNEFTVAMDTYMQLLQGKKFNPFYGNTMRMTCVEIYG